MTENPWSRLPAGPPYVLPDDEPDVRAFNKKAGPNRFLHIDEILPEPFVGAPDAPVVLLSNNPGFGKRAHLKHEQDFVRRMRNNLRHESSDCPFVYLAPDIGEVGKWWERKLKDLIRRFGDEAVARPIVGRSILNIPYFPYASQKFGHRQLSLPSQKYSFRLVQEAIERKAVIVFMRRDDMWKQALTELKKYDRCFQVKNTRNPTISPGNCREGDYEKVVEAIGAAEAKRQKP